ncbi:sigma-70 family RNA polymerase sigma factor [Polyangium sp. y55x31]|uniref:sigma-70 family RNA polymerase sigma factor n=1 Tax=Polyangium sp. y55x31 TaxID=3042688 RepID=UPI0024827E31|nr:sigma-70 family RNA polymerase sigma factor [Polyangium sp. y55x31]MDI1480209.1 sigma-70 family RNA polymerase sigma factor [Polyangium sp. y55x31]
MSESSGAHGSSEIEALVRGALGGSRAAQRVLIEDVLAPVVQSRVARVLVRRRSSKGDLRTEMMDLCQQVFVHVFSGNLLARWEPETGPLGAFVGAIAENHVRSILRSRVRSPFTEIATEQEALELALPRGESCHETVLVSREALRRLEAELDDEEREGFFAFFVDERSIEEMCVVTGKSREAVYKQRQRLRERVRRILDDEAESSRPRPRAAPRTREEGL